MSTGSSRGATASSDPDDQPDGEPRPTRRATVAAQLQRVISAIRAGDEQSVESAVVALSQRNRLLAPLALVVGAFVMLFHGVRLLVTNWRLTLVQVLPAMWIWAAMYDLKAHVLRGKQFHPVYGPPLIPIVVAIAAVTAASFFLNAVFAFAISRPGEPQIRPAFAQAMRHRKTVLAWGFATGIALGLSTTVINRWGVRWFGVCLGTVVAVMMVEYVAVPARLIGVTASHSRRDRLTASAVGGAVGAVVCSPAYVLGRVALVMLGSHTLRLVAVVLLAIAIVLQTGATSAVRAIKLSAKLVAGNPDGETVSQPGGGRTGPEVVGPAGVGAAVAGPVIPGPDGARRADR